MMVVWTMEGWLVLLLCLSIMGNSSGRRRSNGKRLEKSQTKAEKFVHKHLKKLVPWDYSTDVVTVQGTAKPSFLCSQNVFDRREHHSGIDCNKNTILQQQRTILQQITKRYPDTRLLSSTHRVSNTLVLQIPDFQLYEDQSFHGIPGLRTASPHQTFQLDLNYTTKVVQSDQLDPSFCSTGGRGIRVAVLDTGIDYTHEALGGDGTPAAYRRAYGNSPASLRNQQRDGLFPTERVYDGYDFVGDQQEDWRREDDDPIDARGHGTMVGHNILAVAPEAQLMALKVCGDRGCSEWAILDAIEYALDPNNDGDRSDAVHIINLSLGAPVVSAFHDSVSVALENAIELGVVVAVSFGNHRNLPYIAGLTALLPNTIGVAATSNPGRFYEDEEDLRHTSHTYVEPYSSRGPGEAHHLKPDLAAPAGAYQARVGTGNQYARGFGTSFSAPVVSGAAALLLEKCPSCSPLAIKAMLMNNAYRNISIYKEPGLVAPLSLRGAGELRIRDAMEADFWAYSTDEGDLQPSLSLGLLNAAEDMTIQRTIRIVSLVEEEQAIVLSHEFLDLPNRESGAVVVSIDPPTVTLGGCSGSPTVDVTVTFDIDSSKAPHNHLSSRRISDELDENEFDGYVLAQSASTGKEIGIPFHMVLRKASRVQLGHLKFPESIDQPFTALTTIENSGAGIAQVDAYELLELSVDDDEEEFGSKDAVSDFRAVGYRVVESSQPGCEHTLEFVATLWERPRHAVPVFFVAFIDTDGDFKEDFTLVQRVNSRFLSEVVIIEDGTDDLTCSGFEVDHGVGSSNVIMRACFESFGIQSPQSIAVEFATARVPNSDYSDETEWFEIELPHTSFQSDPLNVGARDGRAMALNFMPPAGGTPAGKGFMLVTNGYRAENRTGAATPETETILLPVEEIIQVPEEVTEDSGFLFRDFSDFTGPECGWRDGFCSGPAVTEAPTKSPSSATEEPSLAWTDYPTDPTDDDHTPSTSPSRSPSCMPNTVPRLRIPTLSPSNEGVLCFSGHNFVQVLGRGLVPMRDLRVGENVLVEGGNFEKVYGFGHRDERLTAEYVRIQPSGLEISDAHMLLVVGRGAIPAMMVKPGDVLMEHGSPVVSVQRITRTGAYAPYTPSGKIVVNGVLASNYIVVQDEPTTTVTIGGISTGLSYQWACHTFLTPYRIWRHWLGVSSGGEPAEDGFSPWSKLALRFGRWLLAQDTVVGFAVFIPLVVVLLLFTVVETFLFHPIESCSLLYMIGMLHQRVRTERK